MMSLIQWIIDTTLKNPIVFDFQQKFCNDYSTVTKEFSEILNRNHIHILDVGCSTGTCAGQIIDMDANSYIGLDVVPRYIEIAQSRYKKGQFFAMDARSMTFENNSFDVAIFIGVLHHMDDQLAKDCLAEVHRVLKPTGCVIVAEPVFTPKMFLSNLLLSLDRGRYIRNEAKYQSLFDKYKIERQGHFRFSLHRFCSYVLQPA